MWLGYGLLIVSVGLLIGQPLLVRYAIAALLFKFTWTFVLPFILARVAGLDNSGRLMNSINLVIGGGMAAGRRLRGLTATLRQRRPAAGGGRRLRAAVTDFNCGGIRRREGLAHGRIE
ncbi:permease [Klebsiella pneumoniae]|uniref:Permease n=1 Tax=Klebsiella pneumoniae TaxID=573 RepID=A0A377UVC3_KLEPN|nr:permease [Klebsiella pneumoniae]